MKRQKSRLMTQFKPVCREDKARDWAKVIQVRVRFRDDRSVITDAASLLFADEFWHELERRRRPIIDIMATPGSDAVEWLLKAKGGALIDANAPPDITKPEEPNAGAEAEVEPADHTDRAQ